MESVPEIQAWVDKITASRWWRKRCFVEHVQVFDGRGTRFARAGHWGVFGRKSGWGINMPCWARSELIVLHELAHILIEQVRDTTVAAHGREFCRHFLALVHRWMGQEKAQELRESFRAHGVKWYPKRV